MTWHFLHNSWKEKTNQNSIFQSWVINFTEWNSPLNQSVTVLTLICEIGNGIYNFNSAKHFVSLLRLAPNNRVSGCKVVSSRTPKGSNKLALALRNAANTSDKTKDGVLSRFIKRVAYRKGRGAAITETARKVAVISWNVIVKREPYQP